MKPATSIKNILVTDADNTLWETNAQYRRAQLCLLDRVEELCDTSCAVRNRLAFVRQIDQQLATKDRRGLRYSPQKLAETLFTTLHPKPNRVANRSERRSLDVAVKEYMMLLEKRPRLRSGVRAGLKELHSNNVEIIVLTEGGLTRVKNILRATSLHTVISSVHCGRKSEQLFDKLRLSWPRATRAFAIGDQLDRDVLPAIEAGFTAIHFPSAFIPIWTTDIVERADFSVVRDYRDVLPIMLA